MEGSGILSHAFSVSRETLTFILLMYCMTFIDLWVSSHPYITKDESQLILMCCSICFSNAFNILHMCLSRTFTLLFFFCLQAYYICVYILSVCIYVPHGYAKPEEIRGGTGSLDLEL